MYIWRKQKKREKIRKKRKAEKIKVHNTTGDNYRRKI